MPTQPFVKTQALLTTRGTYFNVKADIPSNKYCPESTTIPFSLEAPDVSFSLSLPRWNTNALHAPKKGNHLAKVRSLRLEGSYQYFSEVRKENVEQLKLKFMVSHAAGYITDALHMLYLGYQISDVAFKELGWSIRYFMVIKDNYLGSFTHFSTLYEYLDKRKRNLPLGDPIVAKYRPGKVRVSSSLLLSFSFFCRSTSFKPRSSFSLNVVQ